MVASMRNLDPKELYAAAQRKLEGIPEPRHYCTQTEEAFRRSEYDALKAGRGAPQSDLLVEAATLDHLQIASLHILLASCPGP